MQNKPVHNHDGPSWYGAAGAVTLLISLATLMVLMTLEKPTWLQYAFFGATGAAILGLMLWLIHGDEESPNKP